MLNKKILTLISFLLLFSFLMAGCMLPPINHPPEITSEAVTTATVGVAYTYDVDATDPDPKDVLTYSLTAEPSGMLIDKDNGVITWTPTAAGDFPVTIQVSDGKLSDSQSFTITVNPIPVKLDHIVLLPETMTLFVGGSKAITSVTAHYDDGSTAGITLGDCTYLSSDVKVATVLAGVVTAVAEGTATITVSYTEEEITKTDTLGVTVREPEIELTGIVVDPKSMTLFAGKSEAIKSVTATYEIRGTEVPIALGDCTYESDDEEVATVLAGVVTAVAEGTATITVIYEGMTDTLEVTVNPVLLISIAVAPKVMDLIAGGDFGTDTDTITSVTAYYNDGSEDDTIDFADCTFASDDKTSAEVSDAGVVTAVAEGTATITVGYGGETDTLEVTVCAVELDHIVVLPGTMTLYLGGVESASKTIKSITAHFNDGTEVPIDFADCTYGLNPVGIVEVDADEVIATKVGEATLTVTYEGKTDAIEVTVLAFELDYIVVVPETMIFGVDWIEGDLETGTITIESVTAHYNDESTADIELGDLACKYESDPVEVATVEVGVITAEAKGTATITVSYEEGEVTAEDFVTVTVPNRVPSIISTAPTVASLGFLYTYEVKAEDPDYGDVLTYFLDTFPIGMNIGPETGVITWYPTDTGEVVTVVGVKDDDEFDPLSTTEEFTITVE